MVSFDVVSLFTNVPIVNLLELLSQHFEDDVLALFKHALTPHISVLMDSSTNKRTG